MSVNTPLRELILINVGRVNGIMQTIAEDVGDLAAENTRLRAENAELRAEVADLHAELERDFPCCRDVPTAPRVITAEELREGQAVAVIGTSGVFQGAGRFVSITEDMGRKWFNVTSGRRGDDAWSHKDDDIIILLEDAQLAAVLRELDVKRSEPRDDFDRGADTARAMIRRAIEEAA